MRSKFYKLFFFWYHLMDSLGNYATCLSPYFQTDFFSKLEVLFSVLGSMVSRNICKLRHKFENAKYLPKLTWSWQNKPWYIVKYSFPCVQYKTVMYRKSFHSIGLYCIVLGTWYNKSIVPPTTNYKLLTINHANH